MKIPMTDEERHKARLASHRKYNTSSKGRKRNLRYEAKHPERAVRWEQNRPKHPPP